MMGISRLLSSVMSGRIDADVIISNLSKKTGVTKLEDTDKIVLEKDQSTGEWVVSVCTTYEVDGFTTIERISKRFPIIELLKGLL